MERIKEKIKQHEKIRQRSEERSFIHNYRRKDRERFIKTRNEEEKRKMSMTLYSRQQSIEE